MVNNMETGVLPIILFSLKIHFKFAARCRKLHPTRYSNMAMNEVIDKKVFWYKDWENLRRLCNIPMDDFMNDDYTEDILLKIKSTFKRQYKI